MDSNFYQKRQEEQELASVSDEKAAVTEFATSDEAIRHDRDQNPPPPEIAERLNQSLANEPKWGTSFWKKLGFRK